MITAADIRRIVALLGKQGAEDIAWAESLGEPETAEDFASEAIYVICNSGMKNTIARKIYDRVMDRIASGGRVSEVFGHAGKAAAIEHIWENRDLLFAAFRASPDRLEFLAGLPWIGGITKFHLAKNFGLDVAKPDVHLKRMADREGVTAQALCERLSRETGYRVATIDTLLWRAAATGILSRTGEIRP